MAAEGCTPQLMSAADLGGIDQNKWPSHDGAERSVQLRTAGTALPSTTPGWMTNRWKPLQRRRVRVAVAPSPDGSHRRAVGTSAHQRPVEEGRGWSVSIGHLEPFMDKPTVDCQSRISRGLDTRGATLATGHLELQRADDSCPAGRPVALSRRCLIFSARPRTDTRSRRTEPRRGCGWSPLPCLSVAVYLHSTKRRLGLLADWCHCRPLSAISHHQTLPNTVWRLMQALQPHPQSTCLAPRCCAALLACPCRVPLSDAERPTQWIGGKGAAAGNELGRPLPCGQTLAPGPHGWLRWAVGSACPPLPCHARMESLSLIFDLFSCKNSLCIEPSAASPS